MNKVKKMVEVSRRRRVSMQLYFFVVGLGDTDGVT